MLGAFARVTNRRHTLPLFCALQTRCGPRICRALLGQRRLKHKCHHVGRKAVRSMPPCSKVSDGACPVAKQLEE